MTSRKERELLDMTRAGMTQKYREKIARYVGFGAIAILVILVALPWWLGIGRFSPVAGINTAAGVQGGADNVFYYLLKTEIPYDADSKPILKGASDVDVFSWTPLTQEQLLQKLTLIQKGTVYVKVQVLKPNAGNPDDEHKDLKVRFYEGKLIKVGSASWLPRSADSFEKPLVLLSWECPAGLDPNAQAELIKAHGRKELVPIRILKSYLIQRADQDQFDANRKDFKVLCNGKLVARGTLNLSSDGFMSLDMASDRE